MSNLTQEKRRIFQIEGTPFSFSIDRQLTDETDLTLMVPVEGGLVEYSTQLNFGGLGIETPDSFVDSQVSRFVMPIAEQIVEARLFASDTSLMIHFKAPNGGSIDRKIDVRFVPS